MPNETLPVLSTAWRWGTGLACLLALGAGGVAVFKTDNDVGSTALLAIGLYFAIVTALGRFPKIKLGDNEIDPSGLRLAAQRGADFAADAAAEAALAHKSPAEVAQAARSAEQNIKRSFFLSFPATDAKSSTDLLKWLEGKLDEAERDEPSGD